MGAVPAFHTSNYEKKPVYHDQDGCHEGKAILEKDKVKGKGTDRSRCEVCKGLD